MTDKDFAINKDGQIVCTVEFAKDYNDGQYRQDVDEAMKAHNTAEYQRLNFGKLD